MQLRIEVSLDAYDDPQAHGNLRMSETIAIGTLSFMELAQVLGRFHETAEQITRERANGVQPA